MCGIVGYLGPREATPLLIEGLQRLEYRGYDSAGIAVVDPSGGGLRVVRAPGKLRELSAALESQHLAGRAGIGHTRWATHGRPSESNAHPHSDCAGRVVVCHNGIIENHTALREELEAAGHTFRSETDSEVIPHLIEGAYSGDLLAAVLAAVRRLRGQFALAVLHSSHPHMVVGVRLGAPLVVGIGEGEMFLASDISALLRHTRRVGVLSDGEAVVLTEGNSLVVDFDGAPRTLNVQEITWDAASAEREGYPHFMLKEINQQPDALRAALTGRVARDGSVSLAADMDEELLRSLSRLDVVACGTSYHAGLVTRHLLEEWARLPVRVEVASEYRYRRPIIEAGSAVLAISQSGETADTLAALREARSSGARVIAIGNSMGSTMQREADVFLAQRSGPEIGVAASKTYLTQSLVGAILALRLAELRGKLSADEVGVIGRALWELPRAVDEALKLSPLIVKLARDYSRYRSLFYIARGVHVPTAFEASLKLKELSYRHAEAVPAGELKHGALALIDEECPVLAILGQGVSREKMLSNVLEVKARGGRVLGVVAAGDDEAAQVCDDVIPLPKVPELLEPLVAMVPLQLFAYHVARRLGCDIDQPRNLAKSVTVE